MEDLVLAAGEGPASSHFAALVAGMGHDLRAPLHAILGASELLIEEMGEGAGRETWIGDLKGIGASGRRLADLLELLIDVARIESGKVPIDRAAVDLDPVVATLIDTLQQGGARIELRCEGAPAPVLVDMRRLKLALGALLRMVLVRSAEPSMTVVITHAATGASVAVFVGPDCAAAWGLAADVSRMDAGLALVHALAAHAGATLSVEAAPDGARIALTMTMAMAMARPEGDPG